MSRRTTVRVEELIEELCIGAAQRLRCDSDRIRTVVSAVVAYLREEYPSQDLYIHAGERTYPVAAIRAAVQGGMSLRDVEKRYRVTRRTIHRLLGDAA